MKTFIILTVAFLLLLFASVAFAVNDCTKITIDDTFKTKTNAEKNANLKNKIWQDVKRNEIPEWNPNIVSAAEMTQAYADLAKDKNTLTKDNLFEGLREKAVAEKITCL